MNKAVFTIPAPHTSQACAKCGHTHPDNRKTQDVFCCIACGHKDNADKNAAKNILRYEEWMIDQKKLLEQKALALA